MACFYCKVTGSKICGGHCGLCDDFDDGKPSERDYGEWYDKGCPVKTPQN